MKTNTSTFTLILLTFISFSYAKADIPAGFEKLFKWHNKEVTLRSLNGEQWGSITLEVQYNKIRISEDRLTSVAKFKDYLRQNQVKESVVSELLSEISSGIENGTECSGKIDNCSIIPESISFYYDYDSSLLYMYANINSLEEIKASKKYESALNNNNALINHLNIYTSNYQDRNSSLTITDKATLGLGYGYANFDYELTYRENSQDNESRLYEASYNLNYEGIGMNIGRFNRSPIANATDFIQPKNSVNEYSLSIFSSDKLRSNKEESRQRLSYFSPANGELRIYQGDRVVFRSNIQAGQGYVSYDNLPYGRNELRLEIINFGKIVSNDLVTVANFSNDNLVSGEVDYFLSTGSLESKFNYKNNKEIHWNSIKFGKSLFAYKANDFLTLALGGFYTNEASYGSFGLKSSLPYNIKADILSELYTDRGRYFSGGFSIPQFSIRYEDFKVGDSKLSSYLHDFNNYYQITANGYLSFPWGDTAYLTLSKGQRSFQFAGDSSARFSKIDYWNAALGYRTSIGKRSNLEVNLDYQGDSDDISISFQLTVPLGDIAQVKSSASWRDGLDQIRNSASIQDSINQNSNYNIAVAHTYYDEQGPSGMLDAYAGYNYSNEYMQAGLNGYIDSWGERGVSANISSTQIIDDRKLQFTKHAADSYILLDIENNEDIDNYGLLSITGKKRVHKKIFIDDKNQVVPLPEYQNYDIYFDPEIASLFTTENSRLSEFTLPGKAIKITRKVARTVSFIAQFVDILEQPLSNIECVGLACNSTQEIDTGIYQVNVLNGDLFQLKQGELVCYISEKKLNSGHYNFGKNYCLPEINIGESTVVSSNPGMKREFIFLGVYTDPAILKNHINRVSELGGEVIIRNIESSKLLFIEKNQNFVSNPKTQELIDHMSALKMRRTKSIYSITKR
ncbi:TcfC E-set like domain-containing protein [Shewanella algae]|uniref:TcfC E-set like domain-containing protein n=1 Tax=Shewanella algae TaxID=38313 RepID=UPI000BB5E976|nr:TcfC E-set like domain-containing protein [Shewanella algae]PBQ29880.1 hypothetical protein AYI97_03330 [Shewanella algae]